MKPFQRVLALTLVLLVMVPLSYVAAQWQLARHEERDARNQLLETARAMDPLQIGSLGNDRPDEYTRIEIQGTLTNEQALWRRQVLNSIPGFTVVRKVALDDGTVVAVALGWTDTASVNYQTLDVSFPLIGFVRYPDSRGVSPSDVPEGQVNFVSEMMQNTDYEFYLQSQRAPNNLSQLALPEIESGPHLGYVGQWILIGIASVVIYIIALRRIRKDYASEMRS